ncbi:MAG TPA: FAD-dependent oxidoreductase [Burkholderiales bacterium]|nr:FAD-dependent oxidoreductase [Burkholderiales bacterium]
MSAVYTDVIVVGFGAAGACAAIEAHDSGAQVILLEKQPEDGHYSSTRMSGGGFHSPRRDGNFEALKAYSKAMFSGENLPLNLEGEQPEFADELAELWAQHAPDNEAFMRSLDPQFRTVSLANAAFSEFPGAAESGYAVVKSTYTGSSDEAVWNASTKDAPKTQKQSGEAFHACLLTGLQSRKVAIHYGTPAQRLLVDVDGAAIGVIAVRGEQRITYYARRGVVLTCGGYEYQPRMRKAFLDGPGIEGWAFYGSPANTGDGIRMALKAGAALTKIGSIAGRVICAIPERRHGLKIGLNTASVGKPNEIVVDNYGRRYAGERRITKDPSRYHFYKEALHFDTVTLSYPRIPSWMVFDSQLMESGPIVRVGRAKYIGIDWGEDNRNALANGWILQGATIQELGAKIRAHRDNRGVMDPALLARTVETYNGYCAAGHDADFEREVATMGPVSKPPFYAIPLYPGGPNTTGGLRSNGRREVLDWDDAPIPRLYTAGEISSVFQFVYQGGGNLAEGITFGRIAGRNAAAERPWTQQQTRRSIA